MPKENKKGIKACHYERKKKINETQRKAAREEKSDQIFAGHTEKIFLMAIVSSSL